MENDQKAILQPVHEDTHQLSEKFKGFGTLSVHAGQPPDPITGSVIPALHMATTYRQISPGEHTGYEYSRTSNPTRVKYEKCVASLEKGTFARAFASGSSCTLAITHLLASGDHIISSDDVYGGTNRFFQKIVSPTYKIDTSFVDLHDFNAFKNAIKPNTKLVWVETPSNPLLKVIDIEEIVKFAHKHDILVCVDNTFATPFFQKPLTLGADLVAHSITKYINGHTDIVGGIVVTNNKKLADRLSFISNCLGNVPSPFDCYQIMRGIKTLHIRMERHAESALKVAKWLEDSEQSDIVEKVLYPGLPSHPDYKTAKKQMSGFSGMVTFFLKGGLKSSRAFLEALELFFLAESLGGVDSLAEHPAIMTHASVPHAERLKLGITDGLVRLSIGIEDVEDIILDLKTALDAAREAIGLETFKF